MNPVSGAMADIEVCCRFSLRHQMLYWELCFRIELCSLTTKRSLHLEAKTALYCKEGGVLNELDADGCEEGL